MLGREIISHNIFQVKGTPLSQAMVKGKQAENNVANSRNFCPPDILSVIKTQVSLHSYFLFVCFF